MRTLAIKMSFVVRALFMTANNVGVNAISELAVRPSIRHVAQAAFAASDMQRDVQPGRRVVLSMLAEDVPTMT